MKAHVIPTVTLTATSPRSLRRSTSGIPDHAAGRQKDTAGVTTLPHAGDAHDQRHALGGHGHMTGVGGQGHMIMKEADGRGT